MTTLSIAGNIKGLKRVIIGENITLLERLLLKMVCNIDRIFTYIVKMIIHILKLNKEELTDPVIF